MTKRLLIAQIIAILMLLWALYPENPYGYYILLRIIIFGVCAFLAYQALQVEKEVWTWILGFTALVYNPFFRIHLTRDIWTGINIVTIILFIITIFAVRKKREKPPESSSVKKVKWQDVWKTKAEYKEALRQANEKKPSPPDVIYL